MTIAVDETVIERAVSSINAACDWVELGSAEDAVEILNYVLDDLESLRTEKGGAREDAAPESLPHRPGRTDDGNCSARSG